LKVSQIKIEIYKMENRKWK